MSLPRGVLAGAATLVLAAILAVAAGAGIGVGQDTYPVGDITVSPSQSVCIGQNVQFSGAGAPAGAWES